MASGDIIKTDVTGKVRWFEKSFGYGFCVEDGDKIDIFTHFSAIQGELGPDGILKEYGNNVYRLLIPEEPVKFDIIESDKPGEDGQIRYAAKNVIRLNPPKQKEKEVIED